MTAPLSRRAFSAFALACAPGVALGLAGCGRAGRRGVIAAPPIERARAAPPKEPTRRVVLDDALPRGWVVEALIVPNFAVQHRFDRPRSGEIARIDARGARGDVVALVRRDLRGGLYDYVGVCEVARTYLVVYPTTTTTTATPAPSAKAPPSESLDVTIRVSESGGAIHVDVGGVDTGPRFFRD